MLSVLRMQIPEELNQFFRNSLKHHITHSLISAALRVTDPLLEGEKHIRAGGKDVLVFKKSQLIKTEIKK